MHQAHPCHHSHAATDGAGPAFAIGAAINAGFVLVEGTCAIYFGSLALLSDAGHNLSDVLGLLLAWGATFLARQRPRGRWTYGLRRTSIMAALANGLLLLVAVGAIAWEAIGRLLHPEPVAPMTVIV